MISIEVIWRLVRTAFATALTQALILQPDWSDLNQAIRVLLVSLVSGFMVALSKGLRDEFGNDNPKKGLINKSPI